MAGKNGHSLITPEKFKQLFQAMLENRLHREQHGAVNGSKATHHEAGAVSIALDLQPVDTLLVASEMHPASMTRNNGANHLAARKNGTPHKKAMLLPAVDASASLHLSQAIAAALRHKLDKDNGITVIFLDHFSDASFDLSAYADAFEVAVKSNLPIIFVAETANGSTLIEQLREKELILPYIAVDAHDAVAIYRVAQESIVRTREGGGPALVELTSYTLDGELEDALAKLHRYLIGKGLPANAWKNAATKRFERRHGNA
jgi:TPP-dependent pyruvate/acetoin dehydrogenase alpha subunit